MAALTPAHALLALLDTWHPGGDRGKLSVEGVRGGKNVGRALTQSGLAMDLLREIEYQLDALNRVNPQADVEQFFADLVPVYRVVLGFSPTWGTAAGTLTPEVRATLRRIGTVLVTVSEIGALDAAGIANLRDALVELRDLVTDSALSDGARGYLLELIHRAIALIDDESSTPWQIQRAAFEVSGAATSASHNSAVDDRDRNVWREKAAVIATAAVTTGATQVVTKLVEAGADHLLGHGGP